MNTITNELDWAFTLQWLLAVSAFCGLIGAVWIGHQIVKEFRHE